MRPASSPNPIYCFSIPHAHIESVRTGNCTLVRAIVRCDIKRKGSSAHDCFVFCVYVCDTLCLCCWVFCGWWFVVFHLNKLSLNVYTICAFILTFDFFCQRSDDCPPTTFRFHQNGVFFICSSDEQFDEIPS